MACVLPYNKFAQTNFSKAQILIDYFYYGRGEAKYDEYIRQGIEDLKANVSGDKYSFLLKNFDIALEETEIGDGNFHRVTMMVLILLSYVLSLDREYLNASAATMFQLVIQHLNRSLHDPEIVLESLLENYDWYIGFYSDLTVKGGCKNKELRVAPFICNSGVFGYNTFLCLYFHNIAPVSIATNLAPRLHVAIETSFEAADHDLRHYSQRYCEITPTLRDKYKEVYFEILDGYRELDKEEQRQRRRLLFFLFFLVNEIAFGRSTMSYEALREVIGWRFISCERGGMSEKKYRRKFLVEVEDLVPVLVEDLQMESEGDAYALEEMADYVRQALLELAADFQEQFALFE